MGVFDRLRSYSPAEIALVTFGATAVTAIVVGSLPIAVLEPLVALIPVVGWLLLTPWAMMHDWGAKEEDRTREPAGDPVERLRERFADGEIDEVEFERQLELLVATENTDPETARERVRTTDRE